jgi:hypothetical protein
MALSPIFYRIDKVNIQADCLGKQFRAHDLRDCDHGQHVEAKIEALLATVNEDTPVNFRLCDVSKEIQPLKLGKVYGFDGIPNECLRHLPKRPLMSLIHLFNHCLRLGPFPAPWKEAKS